MNAATIQTLLNDLLDSAVAELTSPPTRRFIAHGAFAHDCECCAAHLVDWTLAPVDQRASFPVINEITLAVTVLRCYPHSMGDELIPDAADLTTATNELAVDLAELTEGLSTRWAADTLFPTLSPDTMIGAQVGWIGARAIGPAGGFAGWEVRIVIRA